MAKKSVLADFEKSLGELEKLVEQLEQGELPLEQALKQFERGIALTRRCQAALEQAQHQVDLLLEKGGEQVRVPFDEDDDPGQEAD